MSQDGSYFNTNSYYVLKDVRIQHNYFWDMKLRKQLFNGFEKTLYIVQYSPDGKTIGSVRGSKVSLFDALSIEKKWDMIQDGVFALNGIAFSPNSKFLATCGSNSDIEIWDIDAEKSSYRYRNGSNNLWSQDIVKYSNFGKLLLGYHNVGIVVYNAIYTTTKVDPIISNDTLQVYPNPSKNKVSIEIENSTSFSLKIMNQTGNDIETKLISNLESKKLEIDISNFAIGTYYLVLTQKGISKLYKFIKE